MFFNTPEEKLHDDFELLLPGKYRAVIAETTYKQTKRQDGRYVSVCFQVLDGRYKDRRVFMNFNIENPNEMAQKIGRGQFKQFLKAIGIEATLKEEADFHRQAANRILFIDLDQETGKDGRTRNTVRKYYAKDEISTEPVAQGAPSDLDTIPF